MWGYATVNQCLTATSPPSSTANRPLWCVILIGVPLTKIEFYCWIRLLGKTSSSLDVREGGITSKRLLRRGTKKQS